MVVCTRYIVPSADFQANLSWHQIHTTKLCQLKIVQNSVLNMNALYILKYKPSYYKKLLIGSQHVFTNLFPQFFTQFFLNFTKCYIIFDLPFFHVLKAEKKSCLFPFSTEKYSWKTIGETNWWNYVVSQSLPCSWHQKSETKNSPIHEFKVLQNVFESLYNEKGKP